MRKIKFSFILIVIIAIISVVIAKIFFSESYNGVSVEPEWTPVISKTPTQTMTASAAPTLQNRIISEASLTPTKDTNCVYPLEYWEQYPELWLNIQVVVGNTIYFKNDIQLVFDQPSREIQQILLKQLFLSNLNIFSGADPKVIEGVLDDTDQWFKEYWRNEQRSEEFQSFGVQLAQKLSEFNTGLIGPGKCLPSQQNRVISVDLTSTNDTNCVHPLEYWEQRPEVWLDFQVVVRNTIYTKNDIQLVFDQPSQEMQQILLKQFFLSNLNIFSGADPQVIEDVLDDADQWLQEYLSDEKRSKEFQLSGIQLAQKLTEFNVGLIGPGNCPSYYVLAETQVAVGQTATQIVKQYTPTPSLTYTATATRYFVTLEPTDSALKTKKPDENPEPTDPPRPTQKPDTPVPPPQPTDPPPPKPTDAPPEPTDAP